MCPCKTAPSELEGVARPLTNMMYAAQWMSTSHSGALVVLVDAWLLQVDGNACPEQLRMPTIRISERSQRKEYQSTVPSQQTT